MLTYHRTSLLTSKAQTLVNTVNTYGVMGKGIAQEFKFRYPTMFEQYKRICSEGLLDIGKLWLWKGSSQWVLNFPTKRHWRYPSKIEYIERGLAKFCAEYENRGIREIAFPRLGCGNGGLDWNEVRPLMESYLSRLAGRASFVPGVEPHLHLVAAKSASREILPKGHASERPKRSLGTSH